MRDKFPVFLESLSILEHLRRRPKSIRKGEKVDSYPWACHAMESKLGWNLTCLSDRKKYAKKEGRSPGQKKNYETSLNSSLIFEKF
jgi:hypothetical protein